MIERSGSLPKAQVTLKQQTLTVTYATLKRSKHANEYLERRKAFWWQISAELHGLLLISILR